MTWVQLSFSYSHLCMKFLLISLQLLLVTACLKAHDHTLPSGFALEEDFIVGLDKPTDLKIAPDGRIFISEKNGNIRIVENGILLPQPFYSVTTQVPNERGLDGIILDPNFDINGYIYLYYTLPFENKNKVSRVTAMGNTAVPGSEIELIRFDNMWASWHNGAGMAFDSDGKLIIGTGDGTGFTFSQNMNNTLGKILRINTDGSIPPDNPFYATQTGVYRAIAAYGVRNPYTMAASKLSGRIFFNDVGNNDFEEINELIMGKNYGWYFVEGPLGPSTPPDSNYIDPIHAYDHSFGCAVVGATFYEPDINLFPTEYYGKYFFMDYCEGKVMYMDPDNFSVTAFANGLDDGYNNIESSYDGYLYLINITDGKLSRISFPGISSPPLISIQVEDQSAAVGEDVTFSVDATGDTLSFDWYVNGLLSQSSNLNSYMLSDVQLSEDQTEIYALVSNPHGSTFSDTAVLTVVNGSRPSVQFQNIPATYAGGDSIYFSATVTDPDQQTVPDANITWKIDFHHDLHTHPALSPISGTSSGVYYVETYGEVDTNVFYRIYCSAIDSSGLVSESSVDVQPEKVTMVFNSAPEGVEISIDGSEERTNFLLRSVKNLNRTLEVPNYAILVDSLYEFRQWDDAQTELTRTFSARNDTHTIEYAAIKEYIQSVPGIGNLLVFTDTSENQVYYKSRTVSQIKENWDILNPFPWDNPPFPDDYWSARWEGSIVAPVSDLYTFYLFHDGRVSLRLGDTLLIDRVLADTDLQEDTAQIWLNAGDSLPIRLEYDHYLYLARVELDWSYSIVPRHTVQFTRPEVELPYADALAVEDKIVLFPNPSNTETAYLYFSLLIYDQRPVNIKIFDNLGQLWQTKDDMVKRAVMPISIAKLPPGFYFFQITAGDEKIVLKFIKR